MDSNLNIVKAKSMSGTCDRVQDKSGKIVMGDAVAPTFNDIYVSIGKELSEKL